MVKNKFFRKVLAVSMSAAVLCGTGFMTAATDNPVFPALTVSAAATDVKYFDTDGTTIESYNGSATSIVIPAKQNGKYFTTLGNSWGSILLDDSKVTTISFETGTKITEINHSAFYNATSLKKITLPDGLTTIGDRAFEDCSNLTEIVIPATVTSIDQSAFYGCTNLKTVTIQGTDKNSLSIGSSAFEGCTKLTSINLTNRISELGEGTFSGCTALTSINIPSTIETIKDDMFSGCSNLSNVTINEGITGISQCAFKNCIKLTEIRLPKSIVWVEWYIFDGCKNLKRLVVNNKNTGLESYSNIPSTTVIYAPEGSKANQYATDNNLTFYPLVVNKSSVGNNVVEVGKKVTINKVATGGKGTYKYAVYARKAGTTDWTTVQNWTTSSAPVYYTIPSKATYQICVKVADMVNPTVADNFIERKYLTVNGVVANTPLTLTAKLSSYATVKNTPLTLTMSADGGSNKGYKYTVQYMKETDTNWSTIAKDTTKTTVSITPKAVAEYIVRVIVKDSNNLQSETYLTFTSYAQLKNLSTVSVSNKTISVTKKAAGGNGTLSYAIFYKKSSDSKWTTAKSTKFTVTDSGTYNICVKVNDGTTLAKRYFTKTIS